MSSELIGVARDYVRRLVESWLALMSGIASIVLAFVWAFIPSSDSGRHYLVMAALACIVAASFKVWMEERKARLRLEQESGPQILIEVVKSGVVETIRLKN